MKVAIIGRTEILYDTARLLVKAGHGITCILTAKEAPEYTRSAQDFKDLAQELAVPFAQGGKILDFTAFLTENRADIAISINYSGIIPQSIIDLYPFGILNAHGGDLPRYRGNACQAWAILNGERRIGLCVHKMIGGELDNGNILARDYIPIDHRTKITDVWQWMTERTSTLMLEAIEELGRDSKFVLEIQSTNLEDALRCYPRRPEDGRINWTLPAINVLRLVNASNKPYAGAYCDFDGQKLIIWDAELVEDSEIFCAVPGQVTKVSPDFFEVACGVGKLRVLAVQVGSDLVGPGQIIKSLRMRLS